MIVDFLLRLTIWFLLTSDVSLENILIGILFCIFLPGRLVSKEKLSTWIKIFFDIILTVPKAYFEAFQMIIHRYNYEDYSIKNISKTHSMETIFIDIFLITFTPQTLVFNYNRSGFFEIHRVRRNKEKCTI
jgi:multicomponent Na+:H+ antiporter subunit E